jgi:citrate synthase
MANEPTSTINPAVDAPGDRHTPDVLISVPAGLKGVAVTDTEIGDVQGGRGFYHYRQYSATELAATRSLEDVWQLLFDGALPLSAAERDRFAVETRPLRQLPDEVLALLPGVARSSGITLAGLRSAVSLLAGVDGMAPLWDASAETRRRDLLRLVAVTPVLVAALYRLSSGLSPIAADPELGHVANYLYMLSGSRPEPAVARAIEQYLILTVDHGSTRPPSPPE